MPNVSDPSTTVYVETGTSVLTNQPSRQTNGSPPISLHPSPSSIVATAEQLLNSKKQPSTGLFCCSSLQSIHHVPKTSSYCHNCARHCLQRRGMFDGETETKMILNRYRITLHSALHLSQKLAVVTLSHLFFRSFQFFAGICPSCCCLRVCHHFHFFVWLPYKCQEGKEEAQQREHAKVLFSRTPRIQPTSCSIPASGPIS